MSFKFTVDLIPQSPMIHFQHNQEGVGIRGSELKPKLDRFLNKKIDAGVIQAEDSWYIHVQGNPDARPLDYKVHITQNESVGNIFTIPLNKYEIYYGNMGKPESEQIRGVIAYETLTIVCFHQELLNFIRESIQEFFIVTNFGTMQGKGFGGFIVGNISEQINIAPAMVRKAFIDDGASVVYSMRFRGIGIVLAPNKRNIDVTQSIDMFTRIKKFYQVMKSGQNFKGYARSALFRFMHSKEIGNEKAWMKQNNILPATGNENPAGAEHEKKYVRAFLGRSDCFSYNKGKGTITINNVDNGLERIPSCIKFSIINNVVYIACYPVKGELYDKTFSFTNERNVTGRINTPSRTDFAGGEFPMAEFMEFYVQYYNGELRHDLSDMRGFEEVRIVR